MSPQVRSVRLGPVSFRARPRTWLVAALVWGVALLGAVAVLFSGSVNMTPEQFWAALAGVGERADMLLLWEFRMPRAVTGLVVGACLGTAGCLFQALSRNALGSPEIIGLTGGAALGAVASVIVFRSFGWGTAVGAIIGCLGAALLTWVLSPRGFGGGNRLILIGLGVASLIQPVTVLLLTRADSDSATSARLWLTGTLNARNWSHAAVGAVLFAVILPFALLISRHLDAAAPGEDFAAGLGVSRRFTQWTATGVGVALTAAAVAVAGPISFIALAGPHVARRLLKGPTAPAGVAAGTGRVQHRQSKRHHRASALDGSALQMACERRRGSVCRDGRRSGHALPRKRRRARGAAAKRRHLLRRHRRGTRRSPARRSANFGD